MANVLKKIDNDRLGLWLVYYLPIRHQIMGKLIIIIIIINPKYNLQNCPKFSIFWYQQINNLFLTFKVSWREFLQEYTFFK
jgi:hypothetical protein